MRRAADALHGDSLEDLARSLLHSDGDAFERLGADLLHGWSDAELDELQWAPLAARARADHASVQELAERCHPAAPERFIQAFDCSRRHALGCARGPDRAHAEPATQGLWLVPATVAFDRAAPRGGRAQHG